MRDPERIKRILELIRAYWYQYPDLRLGQLIINITPTGAPLYYVEDNILEALLREELKEINRR